MIGENIHTVRKQKGFTLSQLAMKAGISKSYLSNIERNLNQNPSIQIVEKLAAVLEVDVRDLLALQNDLSDKQKLDGEWITFIDELKEAGIDEKQLSTYKVLIDFIKWQNEKL